MNEEHLIIAMADNIRWARRSFEQIDDEMVQEALISVYETLVDLSNDVEDVLIDYRDGVFDVAY